MSEWSELEPDKKNATAKVPVRFSLKKSNGGRARATILVRREVIEKLEMKNWRVRIRLGSGGRLHQLAVVPHIDGPFELQEVGVVKGGGVYRVRLPVIDRFPDVSLGAIERPYSVEREGKQPILVIDLPASCFEPSARKAAESRAAA